LGAAPISPVDAEAERFVSEVARARFVVYLKTCPVCGGAISDERLRAGLPCSKCIPDDVLNRLKGRGDFRRNICDYLEERGLLRNTSYGVYCRMIKESAKIESFFTQVMGSKPWAIQRLWIRRAAKGLSFAMIAPTGVGKTTFGVVLALYLAKEKGLKSYFMAPTTTLVMQIKERVEELARNITGWEPRVVAIHSKLRASARKEVLEAVKNGDFDILITTSNFLLRLGKKHEENGDEIFEGLVRLGRRRKWGMIFVDDVDAVMRSSRVIEFILMLAGFTKEDIQDGMEIITLRRRLAFNPRLERDRRVLEKLSKKLQRRREQISTLVLLASATGNPRGPRVKLFRELLGFEIGARPEFIRNVDDYLIKVEAPYLRKENLDELVKAVEFLGVRGGLVYVSQDLGIEAAEAIASYLKDAGIKAEAVHSKKDAVSIIEAFRKGDINVLVGVATYYGVLVRGLDIPEIIRYAVFVGVPRHKVRLEIGEETGSRDLLQLIPLVRDAIRDEAKRRALNAALNIVRREIRRRGTYILNRLDEFLSQIRGLSDEEIRERASTMSRLERVFAEAFMIVRAALRDKSVIEAIEKNPEVSVRVEAGALYVLIPDVRTYIQASGRTSRLFLGGISKGIAVILEHDDRLVYGLEHRIRWLIDEFALHEWDPEKVKKTLEEVDRHRELIRRLRSGEKVSAAELPRVTDIKTALFIVESPNKARTIARFFGRPSSRTYGRLRVYEVSIGSLTLLITASGGHIYDLIVDFQKIVKHEKVAPHIRHYYGIAGREKLVAGSNKPPFVPIYSPRRRIIRGDENRPATTFIAEPEYSEAWERYATEGEIESATEIIEALRDVAMEVDEVLIGTDPDTEGEKIAFDVWNIVRPMLPSDNALKRVEFHEVTRKAVLKAIENPRNIDENLVMAQLIRRIEDRWIGFPLSKDLQENFWPVFCENINNYMKRNKMRPDDLRTRYDVDKYVLLDVKKLRKLLRADRDKKIIVKLRQPLPSVVLTNCKKRGPYRNLSAGRVQTPVLGWIIEGLKMHLSEWGPRMRLTLRPDLIANAGEGRVLAPSLRIEREFTEEDAELLKRIGVKPLGIDKKITRRVYVPMSALYGSPQWWMLTPRSKSGIEHAELAITAELLEELAEINPPPPYTTDTAISDISQKLRMSSEEIMRILQDLFELGFITYHRTDSTRVSDAGIAVAREYITEKLGDRYFRPRRWGEGGAHECIRPTRPIDEQTLRDLINEGVIEPVRRLESRHFAVYDMIFRRFMASQAAPAKVAKARLKADIKLVGYVGGERHEVRISDVDAGEAYVLGLEDTFDGYLRFYVNVPLVDTGVLEKLRGVVCRPPPPRERRKKRVVHPCEIRFVWIGKKGTLLSEADAVRKMKEKKIGRPSTYAKIMDTIKKRRYVEHNRVLVPTILGMEVYRHLLKKYREFVTEDKTRELEERMRTVEEVGEDGFTLYVKLLTDIFGEMREIEKRMMGAKS